MVTRKLSPNQDIAFLLRYYFGDAVKGKASLGYIHRKRIGNSLRFFHNGLEVHLKNMIEPNVNIPTPYETSYASFGLD